jgi:excisionase family DNA binding protein
MEWLTLNEAAAYLKVQPRTLAQWVRQGKVPGHKLSGTQRCVWRFLERELDATLGPSSTNRTDDGRVAVPRGRDATKH